MSGNAITGLWAEISAGGILLGSGYTTFTYDAISGIQYQVCVADYGNTVFDHWDDGSTNSCRTITPTQATTLTASYQTGAILPPPPSPTQTVTVQSKDLSGKTITGLWTEISSGSTLVSSGYTTMTYDATTGAQYQVCVSNYQNNVFDHWDDGSTNSCRTITPTQATTLTASYKTTVNTSVAIKVQSKDLAGNAITGLWTEIYSGTKLVKSGYTTLSYTGNAGTQYKVCMSNYQNFVFDHWGNGSTNSCKTITPTQATTLTAFYMR
jgi:hypothetical protein